MAAAAIDAVATRSSRRSAGASSARHETVTASFAPFLKWAGGKRQLLPQLRKYLPPVITGRYFEPFLGGGAVFFDLAARGAFWTSKEVCLGDSNWELYTTYLAIRSNVEGVIRLLSTYRYEEDFYYRVRGWDPNRMTGVTVAARMIFLNRCGFNGLYRVNRSGQFNVPFGRYSNPTICDAPLLRADSAALRNVRIFGNDFRLTTRLASAGDVVYCDPPYLPRSKTSNFTGYTSSGFDLAAQEELAAYAAAWAKRGVHVVLSNSNVAAIRKLYPKSVFDLHAVKASRSINSVGSSRGPVSELIIVSRGSLARLTKRS